MTATATAAVLRHETPFDELKAQAFAGKMLGALNNAAMVLMTSIGHRTGLFAALAGMSPATSRDIADASGLAERYVREWLGVMTTSGVVEYDPARKTYSLPSEHAAFLTYGGPVNIAVNCQFLGVTAGVEEEIVKRFGDGKGMHYHQYGRFHEVMAEASNQSVASKLVEHILPLAPGLSARLNAGIDVVDIGCGGGRALLALARAYPKSRFTGLDLCADAFAPAVETAWKEGFTNLAFKEVDLTAQADFGRYDLVLALDAVHDQKDPQGLLKAVRGSLREDGVFLMVEIGGSSHLERNMEHPLGPFLYMMSSMHCTPISLGQGGAGLGAMWGVEMASEMLWAAGFSDVQMTRLPHDMVNAYFVARP